MISSELVNAMREFRNLYTVGNYYAVVAGYEEYTAQSLPIPVEPTPIVTPTSDVLTLAEAIAPVVPALPKSPSLVLSKIVLRMKVFEDRRGNNPVCAPLHSVDVASTPEDAERVFGALQEMGERTAKDYHALETRVSNTRNTLCSHEFLGGSSPFRAEVLERGRKILEEIVGVIRAPTQREEGWEVHNGASSTVYAQMELLRKELDYDWEEKAKHYGAQLARWKEERARQRALSLPQRPKQRVTLVPEKIISKVGIAQQTALTRQAPLVHPKAATPTAITQREAPKVPRSALSEERLAQHKDRLERARQKGMGW